MARIQIVEPYPEIRELLGYVVTGLGHEPVLCASETDCVDDADILVLEPGFPRGLELARRLRAARPELPIVIVSIYPPSPDVAALAPAAYVMKPFALADVQRRLEEAVAQAAVTPS